MPQAAFVAIGLALESAAGAWIIANAATLASAALVVGSIAANSVMQRRAAAKARAAYNASLKDREVMIRSAVAPRRVVLGRDKISGPIVYAESTGSKGQFLHLVIALADGECEAIETIYFNDVALPAADGAGLIQSGEFCNVKVRSAQVAGAVASGGSYTLPHNALSIKGITSGGGPPDFNPATLITGYAHTPGSATITALPSGPQLDIAYDYQVVSPRVRIRKHLGQAGQVADADLVAESAGGWTAAHVGAGVCYLYARLEYDVDVFGQVGMPNISADVKGRKLYDPRTATTVWSDNAALCTAFWLRDGAFGLGATAAEVPAAEVMTAANISDERVDLDALPTQQARYTFNGSFTTEESPRDVLADLLTGMAGNCIWVQGRWLVRAGAYRTPELTLTEDHLAGSSVSIVPKASRGEVFNAVRVTYRDPSQAWAEVQAPLVTNAGYEAQDGRQIVRSVALPAAMDALRAQRLGKIMLERARQAVTLQITTNLRAYDLAPTDTVAVTLPRYGFAGKVFEVRERTWSVEGTLQYTLQETAAGVWAWNYGEATVGDLAPDTDLPNPYAAPAALTGLTVESGLSHLLNLADGAVVARAWVQWSQSTAAFVADGGRIELQWKRVQHFEWQSAPPLPGDAINAYVSPVQESDPLLFRVRAVNASGRASDWTTELHVVAVTGATRVAWATLSGRPQLRRVVSVGYSATTQPLAAGYYDAENDTPLGISIARSHRLITILRSTGAVIGDANYDVYGVGALGGLTAADLAAALNGLSSAHIVVLIGYDEPKANRLTSGLPAAVYRCGGSRVIFGSSQFKSNSAYVLIGIAGCGEGNGYECYAGDVDGDVNAWCDVTFQLLNGNFIVSGSSGTPRTLADYSYFGDLDATNGAIFGVNIGGQAATSDISAYAVSAGAIADSSTATGSTGTPGASVRATTMWGPTVTTAAGDELELVVSGLHTESFWSQAAVCRIEIWLTRAPYFGGPQTEFGTRRKFLVPVDVYTNDTTFAIDMHGQLTPGAVTQDYVLRYTITFLDAGGSPVSCAKDFTADAQWRLVRRKR